MADLVVKDNSLIQASYSLGLVEARLILLAIVEARETGLGITPESFLEIHAAHYADRFDVEKHTAYKVLSDAVQSLFNRQITLHTTDLKRGLPERQVVRWVSGISYVEGAAIVKIRFAPDVVPLITRLEQNFTWYELGQVAGLQSAYAVRLYELLIQWRSIGKTPVFDLAEFRQQLGVAWDEYPRMFDFKRFVLDLAITQINAHTDIVASYEQHKTGRIITSFTFTISPKAAAKPKPRKKPKEQQLDLLAPQKPALPDDTLKIASDFSNLDNASQELILKNIQNELSGLKESQFIIELSAYNATGSTAIFQHYKDYFARGLAVLGYL